jgi:hypothetical protein
MINLPNSLTLINPNNFFPILPIIPNPSPITYKNIIIYECPMIKKSKNFP